MAPAPTSAFLIRFGAPIFVEPVKPQDALQVEEATVTFGELRIAARNTGNRHQVITAIHLRGFDTAGAEVYAKKLADRYILAGAVKSYSVAITPDLCARLAAVEVEVTTDKLNSKRRTPLDPASCSSQ